MRTRIILAFICFSFFTAMMKGCRKDGICNMLVVKMTDAAGDYQEVNVDIRGVDIHYNNDKSGNRGWTPLFTNAKIYNLMELQNDVNVVLAIGENLPIGHISELRIILGDENSVVAHGKKYPLHIPGGNVTGIKIELNIDINTNKGTELILDFDVEESVMKNNSGDYMLKPVIHIISEKTIGTKVAYH